MPRIKLNKSAIDVLPTPSSDIVYWDAAYQTHYPGSPIAEIGRDAAKRGGAASKPTMALSPDDPLTKAHKKTAR